MKTSHLKRGGATLMALLLCLMPACSTAQRLEGDYLPTAPAETEGALPTEGALTTPSYYTPEQEVVTDSTYTSEYQLKLLADRDFGGSYFVIVQEKGLENAIFPDTDDLVDVYAERRNRMVTEKYNVELASRELTAEEIVAELTESAKTGVYFCDLLIVSPPLLQKLQSLELLVSLDSLPFFETDSVCISEEATAELNADWDGIYGIWGDVLRQPTRQLCVYYNTELAEKLDCPNFYATVRSGSWDIQTMLTAAELTVGSQDAGAILYDGSAKDLLLAASDNGSTFDEEAHLALLERMNALQLPVSADGADAYTRFMEGESLFYIGMLGELQSFSMTECAFGVLPFPKYSASDDDYPGITDQSSLPILACPINVTTAAGTGIMLSALNAASCDDVNGLFLQSVEPHVRDNGSTLMIPYLIGDLHFDRRLIFSE